MASRTWLAVVLCCLVWFGYMRWFAPPMEPRPATETNTAATTTTPTAETPPQDAKPLSLPVSDYVPVVNHSRSTDKVGIGFSDLGGQIALVDLKEYTRTLDKQAQPIQLVGPDSSPLTGATLFSDPKLQSFGTAQFKRSEATGEVQFQAAADGIRVEKSYRYQSDPYRVDTTVTLHFDDAEAKREWGYLFVPLGRTAVDFNAEDPLRAWETVGYLNDSIERETVENIENGERVFQGATRWVSFGNRYFVTAAIHKSEINPDMVYAKSPRFTGAYLRYPIVLKKGESKVTYQYEYFFGPKDYSELAKIPGMKKLIDYGTFSFLAFPLLELLRFFYSFVGNYGLAIILLTILVRILFYPLSVKSMRSMKAMQKLQPQITALKEKYKDDAQKFGQEQMALFRQHKVNPAGGCLPMLVQLPVFIALYAVLGNSIELFHAPFFGWIQDLSAKDPYYVFPVLMGISMLVQQIMTPAAGMDPAQRKMLMAMPVVFSFFMLSLPSGLTIYIFLSTLLGILQQVMMNRHQEQGELVTTS